MIRILISMILHQLSLSSLKRFIQPIRDDGPTSHFCKQGVPTMGGLVTLLGLLFQLIIYGLCLHPVTQLLVGFGLLGFYDDVKKLYYNSSKGLSAKWKFCIQCLLALAVTCQLPVEPYINILGSNINLGMGYPIFAMFVIVGTSNAFNLTDGIDGLAASQALVLLVFIGALGLANDHMLVANISEMAVIMLLGFMWVNHYPAKVFMGDVGSLPIGALLGVLAVMLKVEILFACVASVLVWETVSVILQVVLYKRGRGRLFKMAPFHHHLELSGWSEKQIVLVFTFITLVLVLVLGSYGV